MSTVNRVVAVSKEYLTQWKEAQSWGCNASLQPLLDGYSAIFKDQEVFPVGLIARDDAGGLVQAKSKLFQDLVDPEVVEIMAIKEDLSSLIYIKWSQVIWSPTV